MKLSTDDGMMTLLISLRREFEFQVVECSVAAEGAGAAGNFAFVGESVVIDLETNFEGGWSSDLMVSY
jgi:hypothetical protein